MKPKVVNIKRLPKRWIYDDDYVYIGREGKGFSGTFGNPFPLEDEKDRDIILDKYRQYLENRVQEDAEFCNKVKNLKNKILVCFCKPKTCHGDVLAEMVEKLNSYDLRSENV